MLVLPFVRPTQVGRAICLVFFVCGLAHTPEAVDPFCVRAVTGKTTHRVPSVFLIGQAKCGTSTLFSEMMKRFEGCVALTADKAMWRPENARWPKEPHYFSMDPEPSESSNKHPAPTLRMSHPFYAREYTQAFPKCEAEPPSDEFAIDSTPGYLRMGDMSSRNIRDFYANSVDPPVDLNKLKFMISLRDPIRRTRSCFDFALTKGRVAKTRLGLSTETNWQKWVLEHIKLVEECIGSDATLRHVPQACQTMFTYNSCILSTLDSLYIRQWLDAFPEVPATNYFITDLEKVAVADDDLWTAMGRWAGRNVTLDGRKVMHKNEGSSRTTVKNGPAEAELKRFFEPWERELTTELCRLARAGATVLMERFDVSKCPVPMAGASAMVLMEVPGTEYILP